MKREELDKLREKYFAGNTSLEEERQLKELENEEFFNVLKEPAEKMDWDFESFLEKTNEVEEELKPAKVIPLKRRLMLFTSIAASLLLGFFFVQQWLIRNTVKIESHIAYQQTETKESVDNYNSFKDEMPKEERIADPIKEVHVPAKFASVKKVERKAQTVETVEPEDEMYVEINGIRIYDEERALEITETALHLATSNLKKGMEGVENIKYLKIEI
jgi:hypothetical protein